MPVSRRSVLQYPLAAGAAAALAQTTRASRTETPVARSGRIRQSGVAWCYGGPLDELARLCATLGGIGVDVVHPNDWPTLQKHGMACTLTPCMDNGFGTSRGLNKVEHHEPLLALMHERIDASAAAGYTDILAFSGNREDGLSDAEGLRNTVSALRQIAGYAEEKGQVIVVEILNSKRDHRGYMFDHMAWGLDMVQAVGSNAVRILYDIYHAQIMEGDVIQTIRDHHDSIGHYHTAGVPGRHNLDETQELYYPAIMEAIAETGYEGIVAQEFIPVGDRAAALTHAFELCDV